MRFNLSVTIEAEDIDEAWRVAIHHLPASFRADDHDPRVKSFVLSANNFDDRPSVSARWED